jgi:hypothetical protein
MSINASAYLVGRQFSEYPCDGNPVTDILFAGQRLDEKQIEQKHFHHCTFANISFKDATLKESEFMDCTFIGCYFRKAKIKNCTFVASKFISCQFPKVSVQSCNFNYAHFEGCIIPYSEMQYNLSPEPNIRLELSANLAHAAETIGLTKEACSYQLDSIKAQESHLWAAVFSTTTWYQEHYKGTSRAVALFDLIKSKIDGLIWGHGERWEVLLRNFAILTFIVFPVVLWLLKDGLATPEKTSFNFLEIEWLSISTILSINGLSNIAATSVGTKIVMITEVFLGLVIAGLFISLIFRSISRR